MSRPIRVLICDDSATIRRLLDRLLRESGEIEVVGQAVHGEDALRQIPTARPDVLLLDLEMPVLDGLSTLRKLRERDRYLPVIVFSALTQEGSRATLDALALGAHDYVTKPSAKGTIATQLAETREQLVPRVIALGRRAAGRSTKGRPTGPPPSMPNRPELVAIGASTGGPQALTEILARFPQPFPVPILITQHMPAAFTGLFARRLGETSGIPSGEATDGQLPLSNHIHVAPGGSHLLLKRGRLRLDAASPHVHGCRPAVDPLFESIAHEGVRTLAIVLTGMGMDGAAGAAAIRRSGGLVYAQDAGTSLVFGMPRAVIDAGAANLALPLHAIPGAVAEVFGLRPR